MELSGEKKLLSGTTRSHGCRCIIIMANEVTVESACANINRSRDNDNVVCCLRIPNELLHKWYTEKKRAPAPVKIVDELNKKMTGFILADSLEVNLNMKAARITTSFRNGNDRRKVLNKFSLIDVCKDDIVNNDKSIELLR